MRPWSSFRARFVATALSLGLALSTTVLYTQNLVNGTVESGVLSISQSREIQESIDRFAWELQRSEATMYHYLMATDDVGEQEVVAQLQQVRTRAHEIAALPVARLEHFRAETGSLVEQTERLLESGSRLARLSSSVVTRYPGLPLILDALYPTAQEFQQALQFTLAEESPDPRVRELFHELRYAWLQQIMQTRLFFANRFGVYGAPQESMSRNLTDRLFYVGRVHSIIAELRRSAADDRLDFQQLEALDVIVHAAESYELVFERAAATYQSVGWRADLPLLEVQVLPAFTECWELLQRLNEKLSGRLQQGLVSSMGTARTLGFALWGFAGVAYALMLASFFAFERVIRRPVLRVARALEAEGRGEAYVPVQQAATEETELLINAFEGMRSQVRTRQQRLELILDNARDGIVTFDDAGVIETFNKSAEVLFHYPAEEMVGHSITRLLPGIDSIDKLVTPPAAARELPADPSDGPTVTARRRDGTDFIMSIKVGEMELGGRRLYTALVADVSERQSMLRRLHRLAKHDTLTGLYNRHCFQEELSRVVERAARGGHAYTLVFIDLDNFKYVNDTLGHQAGDRVLLDVAKLLQRRVRRGDLIARLGGDEFAILLYEASGEQGMAAAEGFRNALADYVFLHQGHAVDVGCSIGLATLTDEVTHYEELMARADLACHIAKRQGRNRCHLFAPADRQDAELMTLDMGWARRIKDALERNSFVLVRQPIMDVDGRTQWGYEVLLRLREGSTLVMPSGFLPSAERFGLAPAIDRWVIEQVATAIAHHSDGLRYSVNLGAQSLADPELLKFITRTLDRHQVAPAALMFEVTETAAIFDLAGAADLLSSLRALGCLTAVDDFGAGYSSFAYLRDLPVDFVKLDGTFVRNLCNDPISRTMVHAINDIAHAMGKCTVAEQIEDDSILAQLDALGVDYVQGFAFGKPERFWPPDAVTDEAAGAA